MKHLTYRIALIFAVMALSCASAFAQQVKGTVRDSAGEPVIGAAVVVEGTTNGTVVDLDGNFMFDTAVPSDAFLVVTSIGYKTARVPVGEGSLNIVLEEDTTMLEETVVVGYGVQKKSVVTAAISSITSEDLKSQSQTRVDNLLQGMTSGVVVTTPSGAPDAAGQVRVRGVGSINGSDPLYIIDGFAVSGGIDYLNPNDIERIEVLKDAASGAVYGARAANGVILVTTKQGQKGKTKVNYDFSYGWQNPWRKPSVLNATEYAIMMNEGYLNAGQAPVYDDPYSFGEGTDWVGLIFNNNAPVMKHDLNVSGGNEKTTYSTSFGYLSREGTIGGNYGRSNYDRFTVRQTLNSVLFDNTADRSWLNKMTMSTSVSYAHINSTGISNNSEFGSPLGSALGMSPLLDVYATPEEEESYKTMYPDGYAHIVRDASGRAYTVVDGNVYNEQTHPLASLSLPGTKYDTDKFVANGAVELNIWDALKFRSSVGIDLAFWGNHGYTKQYFLSSKSYNYNTVASETTYDKDGNATTTEKINYAESAQQEMNRALRWQVENVISYDKTFGKHSVAAVLGQTAIRSTSSNVGANARGLMYPYDEWKISVNNTVGQQADGNRNGWGSWNSIAYSLLSYFGRVSYNYDERYMAEVTMRADASSNFGPNNKWGYFPSFSLGWNAKNEEFLKDVSWLSALKLRGSWGINGNDQIGSFRYAVYMSSGNNYTFGSGANGSETISIGAKPNGLANPNAKWEQSIQTDIGVDMGFLGNRVTFTADWYNKVTSGMLMDMQVPGYAGDSAPIGNVGTMSNSGVELDLGYRDDYGDFSWSISANATYTRNVLTELGDDATSLYGSSHKIGQLTRGIVGLPFPYFYGHKSDGIFQNAEEVAAHVNANGQALQPNAQPGDVRFVDVDGDGDIDDDDRTYIGKGTPDWSFGLNIGFEWKGIDFNMLLQGVVGNQAFNVTRRTDLYYINLPKTILNRWTGEGTSDTQPRFMFDSPNNNYRSSDLWVEDASFLRARNVQLGYTLPQKWTKKFFVQRLRVYAQAENLFTLTKYSGCDPEVTGGNGFSSDLGVDRGVYPQSRTFSVGVNLNF
ncbi:MAG: TonB-dependent receptor [Bacteroidales bacterium]|nr:TonB-dependent receptor [Bacteroidales bacterium]